LHIDAQRRALKVRPVGSRIPHAAGVSGDEMMNKETTTAVASVGSKSRRWIIAGLATATVAAAGATLGWSDRALAHGPMMGHGFGFHGGGSADPAVMAKRIDAAVQWMLADVDATDDQRARIASVLKAAANDMAPLRKQHIEARRKTMELLAAPSIDRAQIESIRVQQLQLADTATRRMTQAMTDAAEVLNPDQRAKLVAKWQQHRGHRRGAQS
jgi:Spy/CpxP family protein refolding chaperone